MRAVIFFYAAFYRARVLKWSLMLRIVAGSYEHNLLCVALDTEHEVFTPIFHFTPHTQSIRCLASSKRVLASGANDEHIRLYDLGRRRELGTLMHHDGAVLCLQFYKSKWLFSGSADGAICLWRTKDWEILAELKAHKAAVVDLAIHKSGKIMLSVGDDHRLVLWNLMTARKAAVRKLRAAPRQVAFVPSTTAEYVVAYQKSIDLCSQNGETLKNWTVPSSIHKIGFYGELLLVSCDNGQIILYNLNSEDPVRVLQGHAARVKDFSVLDNHMASVSTDGNIVVWDLDTWAQIAVYNAGDRLNCVALVPDSVENMRKRAPDLNADADFASGIESALESEAEEETKLKKPRKKKTKVTVTEG